MDYKKEISMKAGWVMYGERPNGERVLYRSETVIQCNCMVWPSFGKTVINCHKFQKF